MQRGRFTIFRGTDTPPGTSESTLTPLVDNSARYDFTGVSRAASHTSDPTSAIRSARLSVAWATITMMPTPAQPCATPGCVHPAAFKARSRPAWCLDCLTTILSKAGLEPAEPFKGRQEWWLTNCLACKAQVHYRLDYILDRTIHGEKTCRICFWESWAEWAARQREGDPYPGHLSGVDQSRAGLQRYARESGYDLITTAEELGRKGGAFVAKCSGCGRLSVARHGDLGSPCGCTYKGGSKLLPAGQKRGSQLLIDSDSTALAWWDHAHNDESLLKTVTLKARRLAVWRCPDCELRFEMPVHKMTQPGPNCPGCQERRREQLTKTDADWAQTPVSSVPELVAAWPEDSDPSTVMVGTDDRYSFRCTQGHQTPMRPITYLRNGCIFCRGEMSGRAEMVAELFPEVAAQWHPKLNRRHTPRNVKATSHRLIWWRADCCGHEWEATPTGRVNGLPALRCPQCKTVLGSLAYENPTLAAEWSPSNPVTAWQVSPIADTTFLPEWICTNDPSHVWQAPVRNRTAGSGCPQCRDTGKSRTELEYHAAAAEIFGDARSGVTLRSAAFKERTSWTVDISLDFNDRTVVIEYDGSYWHADKTEVDERKTQDLLAAGCIVVRLREHGLPGLGIDHSDYREFTVYPNAPRPTPIIEEVQRWLQAIAAT